MNAAVITVSDRCSRGEVADRSGPLAAGMLEDAGVHVAPVVLVPDDTAQITAAVTAAVDAGADVVLTTGGTGIAPRDVTPEAVRPLLDKELPGIAEVLRSGPRGQVPTSVLSRGVAGIVGRTLVVTLPGSKGGVRDGLMLLTPLLAHIVEQLAGGDHPPVPG